MTRASSDGQHFKHGGSAGLWYGSRMNGWNRAGCGSGRRYRDVGGTRNESGFDWHFMEQDESILVPGGKGRQTNAELVRWSCRTRTKTQSVFVKILQFMNKGPYV
ncbi:hypothetical protein EVAR_69858_1 [Eumeta japonica]|uniref:Uncharacterized protein n=1 Tax=Eumeta variegata TaxID=151549 RepID=A0A4C2AFW7_EUMVA|nr:hypothetical protein EVAR_69858_1 [Eumeta japonica]